MNSSELNLNRFTDHQILTQDLDMREVCAKMVPKNLTTEQKANRRDVCRDLVDRLEREPEFFIRVISRTQKSWILEYDPETKRQSQEWHTAKSPRPKKARMSKSKIKYRLICFFDSQGIVHKEFVPPEQTVNQIFIGKSLKDSEKGWHVCDQALHARGCCTTTPHVTRQSPSMNIWQKKKHSCGSSPGLSPCGFFLFPPLKNHLKGRHFGTLDNILKSVTDELKGIPTEAFQYCYEQWKQRLRRCVVAQGNYFEWDNHDL